MKLKDLLTVVIPCKNEKENIKNILGCLNNQNDSKGLLVIVADISDDLTTIHYINSERNKNIDVLRYFIEELQFDIINADDLFRLDMWFYAFVDPYLIRDTRIVDYLVTKYPQLLTRDLLESISTMLLSINPDNVVVIDYINSLLRSENLSTVESLSYFLQRPIRSLDQQYREIQSGFSEISEEEDTF